MDGPTPNCRKERGLALAQAKRHSIKRLVGTKFFVPSASSSGGGYVVDTDPKVESCSCLDWARSGGHDHAHRCKHLWAVIHVLRLPDGSELLMEEKSDTPKKKDPRNWKARNWKATNACRTLIPRLAPKLLAQLFDGAGLPVPRSGERGRPAVPLRDILLIAALRELGQMTAGEAVVAIEDYCDLGIVNVTKVPRPNTLLDRFAKPELMPHLHRILAASALPLLPFESGFAADGTGFGSSVHDHYFTQKHGSQEQRRRPTKRHRWIEAMIAWGIQTHVIVAAQIMEQHPLGGEVRVMPELLRRAIANGARVTAWYGDAAYLAEECAAAVEKVGAEFYVDWKRGVTGKTKKGALHRLYRKFRADPELYRGEYEKGRPLAETGNMMLKERFGHSMRSRTSNTQYAECMLRCICHNVACLVMAVKELGIEPKYWEPEELAKLPDFGSTQPTQLPVARTQASTNEAE